MAKFFVGQRVRIVGYTESVPVGSTATVIAIEFGNHEFYGIGTYNDVDVDGYGRINTRGLTLAYRDEDLEPLTPPHDPCESDFKESLDRLC